ncbi:MAG: DUF192 domain-containing protein [Pseudomonadota bacterium]|jgi:uncharacterized membrane protein (UPF0127 family)
MNATRGFLRCALVAAASTATAFAAPTIELNAGMYRIEAELAATGEARATGLMHRAALPAHRGMLFVFPDRRQHCMWMRNTLIPLSVAFLDDGGVIVNIEEMEPQTLDNHCAAKPVRYALEMNAGWFRKKGMAPGARIGGLDKAPLAR